MSDRTATPAERVSASDGRAAQPVRVMRAYLAASELLALGYIAVIAWIAHATGAFYVLFPELGALAYDTLTRPRGRWCNAPIHLATTPVLTGVVGIAITRILPYGLPSVLLTVAGALFLMLGLSSPIAPSISAGLLPLVVDVESWWYPPGVMVGTLLLTAMTIVWRPFLLARGYRGLPIEEELAARREAEPPRPYWMVSLFAFVIVGFAAVMLTGHRFVLFPPLVVIAYEMMRHPATCPWATRRLRLPAVCLAAAAGGLFFHDLVGVNPAGAALAMAWGIVVVRTLGVHVPPALAVALLPMVMDEPTWAYPLAVGAGTALLVLWFAGYQNLIERSERAHT